MFLSGHRPACGLFCLAATVQVPRRGEAERRAYSEGQIAGALGRRLRVAPRTVEVPGVDRRCGPHVRRGVTRADRPGRAEVTPSLWREQYLICGKGSALGTASVPEYRAKRLNGSAGDPNRLNCYVVECRLCVGDPRQQTRVRHLFASQPARCGWSEVAGRER